MSALLNCCKHALRPACRSRQFAVFSPARLPRQTTSMDKFQPVALRDIGRYEIKEEEDHDQLEEVEEGGFDGEDVATGKDEHLVELEDLEDNEVQDSSAYGHLQLQQERKFLRYLRLIEHEMPHLVAYRKPFVPPAPSNPLVVRSVTFGGEDHPLLRKRVVVVPVARLPLKDDAARHKFKLLAGVRWSPEPPKDSGFGPAETGGQHGYVKIACEDFPEASMNLKWISDTIDSMLKEANYGNDKFADVPIDTRHLLAKARKSGKGEHARGRGGVRPSIKNFPSEWLSKSEALDHSESTETR